MQTARQTFTCSLVLLLAGFAPDIAVAQPERLPAKDTADIRAEFDGMVAAWNQHDMHAYVRDMADDVEWVNVVGMRWRGKDEVFRAHEAFHKTVFAKRQIHDPEQVDVRAVAPDAAIVTAIEPTDGYTSPNGREMPPTRDVLTLVYARRNGKWLLVEGHNTTIVEAAQASNPVHH